MRKITSGLITTVLASLIALGGAVFYVHAAEEVVVVDETMSEETEYNDSIGEDEFLAEPTVFCDTREEAYAAVRNIIRNRINNMSLYGADNYRGYDEAGYVYDRIYVKNGVFDYYSIDMLDVCDFEAERAGMAPYEGDYMYNLIGNRYNREFYYEGPTIIHPDDGTYGSKNRDGIYYDTYEVYLPVITTLEEEDQVDKKVEQLLNTTFAKVQNGTNEQKIKAVYDYITKNVKGTVSGAGGSDRTYPLYHTAYHALIKGNGTCEAFAQLFTRLTRELGVPSKVIMGIDANNHTYNIVDKGDGYWYFIDTNRGIYLTGSSFKRAQEQERYTSYRYIKNYWERIKGGTDYKAEEVKVIKDGEVVFASESLKAIYDYVINALADDTSAHCVIRFDCDWKPEYEDFYLDYNYCYIPDRGAFDFSDRVSVDLGGHKLIIENWKSISCDELYNGTVQGGPNENGGGTSAYFQMGVGLIRNVTFVGTTRYDHVFLRPEMQQQIELDNVSFKKTAVVLAPEYGEEQYTYELVISNDVTLENCSLYIMDQGNTGHAAITSKVCDASGKVLSAGQLVLKGTNTLGMKDDHYSYDGIEENYLFMQKPIEFNAKNGRFTEGDVLIKSAAAIKKYNAEGKLVSADVWDVVDRSLTEANKDPDDGSSLMNVNKGVAFGTGKKANPVKSVTLNKTSVKLGAGSDKSTCEEFVLSATTLPVDADKGDVKFECDKPEYLTVTDNGDKTALIRPTGAFPAGKQSITVTVTAVAKDGSGKSAKCKVTIGKMAESVTISASRGAKDIAVGKTLKLTATIVPKEAINKEVVWDSSDKAVATVDKKGNVKALSVGSTTITAKSSSNEAVSANYEIKTYVPVKKVTLVEKSVSIHTGNSFELKATVTPDNATFDGGLAKVSYSVISGGDYISVDEAGHVTAGTDLAGKSKQSAKILVTAESDGNIKKTATCTVTVTRDPVLVKSIKPGTKKLMMAVGDNEEIGVVVLPVTADKKELDWQSDKPGIVTVDSHGNVTAVAVGTAKITATSNDGSKKKATITVVVK